MTGAAGMIKNVPETDHWRSGTGAGAAHQAAPFFVRIADKTYKPIDLIGK